MSDSPSFPIRDVWETGLRHLGRRVVVLLRADSTNSRALEAASRPDSAGLAYLADEQEAGRGQHGRTWLASPGASVLLSVLASPPAEFDRPAILTALAAVCVSEVARRTTGLSPRIKWPNDVLLEGHKVAGILIERANAGPAVVGIGLNVTQAPEEFHRAGLTEATSLSAMGARATTDEVARLLLRLLDEEFSRLLEEGPTQLESAWCDGLALSGKEVVVEQSTGTLTGRVLEVAFSGVILRAVGTTRVLAPESILRLTAIHGADS